MLFLYYVCLFFYARTISFLSRHFLFFTSLYLCKCKRCDRTFKRQKASTRMTQCYFQYSILFLFNIARYNHKELLFKITMKGGLVNKPFKH